MKKRIISFIFVATLSAIAILLHHLSIINSVSMEPTLLPGDIVLCSRCVKLNGINQNDIVIFRSPDDDSTLLVKRVYDINKVVSGKIYYDMRGDNKENSCDSRYFGLIPMNKLEGKVKLIIASWDGERHFFRMNRFWKGV